MLRYYMTIALNLTCKINKFKLKLFEERKKANRIEPLSADPRTEPIREPLILCQNRIEPNRGYPRITAKNLI